MAAVTVRQASPAEADIVCGLVRDLLRELGEEGDEAGTLDVASLCDAWRSGEGHRVAFIAVGEGGAPVGVVTVVEAFAFYANGRHGIINEMYVTPACRAAGVGALLIEAVKTLGRQRGWRRVEVTAPQSERWQRTRRFYEKQGFAPAGPKLKCLLPESGRIGPGAGGLPFVPRSIELNGGFTIPAPPAIAFELFSPLGEKRWVPGWDPEMLHPAGAAWERGLIFRTAEERGDATWVVTGLDRARHEVEYHRVEAGRYVARVHVRCRPEGAGRTKVGVAYLFVGLGDAGNEDIAGMSAGLFEEKMRRWRTWIEACLSADAPHAT